MTRRDRELLDKQLWAVSPTPPRNNGLIGLSIIAVFVAGMAIGSFGSKPPRLAYNKTVAASYGMLASIR
jgi:hypothetical protein